MKVSRFSFDLICGLHEQTTRVNLELTSRHKLFDMNPAPSWPIKYRPRLKMPHERAYFVFPLAGTPIGLVSAL